MKTALTWIGIISFALVSWALGNPPWLGTLIFLIVGLIAFYAVTNLEEKMADVEYENTRLKEDLDGKERWIFDLERRIEDLESETRAR